MKSSLELQKELDYLNKMIFETAVKENAHKYVSRDIETNVNNDIAENIENAKLSQKIASVNAMIDFYQNGGNIIRVASKITKREKRLYR